MRSAFDFTPYRQSWIGYDHLFDLLETERQDETAKFPPFDLEQSGETTYRLRLAVAGFAEENLEITTGSNVLTVSGRFEASERNWLYRGIPNADFDREFQLADFVVVTGARLADGILEIELERQIPDAVKPRKVVIGEGAASQSGDTKRRTRAASAAKAPKHDRPASPEAKPASALHEKEPVFSGAW